MRKRIAFILVTVCVLLITGCGASNSEEDWEDNAFPEEYAAYGIEKEDNFYYYQGELVYIIKDQRPDSSVYLLNTDSKGTVSIKVIRNAEGEITSVTYMTKEEVAKALPRILGELGTIQIMHIRRSFVFKENAQYTL